MQGHRCAAGKGRAYKLVAYVQLIQAMPALMRNAQKVGKHIFLMIMRGKPYVVLVERGSERVLDLAYNAAVLSMPRKSITKLESLRWPLSGKAA